MAAAGGNSRFAVTCGLLRQYMMREQQPKPGGLDGASRLPLPTAETEKAEETDGRTMQLFPTRGGTLRPSQELPEAQAKAPLTIFYEGRVLVFEDFPVDKAKELMQLAGSGTGGSSATPQNKGSPAVQEKPAANPSTALPDLPIARKASLQRFLQKRKHRINATEPYNKVTACPPVPEKDVADSGKPARDEPAAASWLGL